MGSKIGQTDSVQSIFIPLPYAMFSLAGGEAKRGCNLFLTDRKTRAQRTCETQFLFRSVHGPAKMHYTMDDLAFSLAEPFSFFF